MGAIPPSPPPLYGSREERREQLIDYRDHLLRMQRYSSVFRVRGDPVKFPSRDFTYSLLILSPWILSVIAKLWMGDWFLW